MSRLTEIEEGEFVNPKEIVSTKLISPKEFVLFGKKTYWWELNLKNGRFITSPMFETERKAKLWLKKVV